MIIITRHGVGCAHSDDPQYKRCNCRKHLRWFQDGKTRWQATKQRTWAGAERVTHEFEQTHDPTRRAEQSTRVTVRDAIDTLIQEKKGQNVSATGLGKYRREPERLHTYLELANVFHLENVTLPHLTGFRATWTTVYQHQPNPQLGQ